MRSRPVLAAVLIEIRRRGPGLRRVAVRLTWTGILDAAGRAQTASAAGCPTVGHLAWGRSLKVRHVVAENAPFCPAGMVQTRHLQNGARL